MLQAKQQRLETDKRIHSKYASLYFFLFGVLFRGVNLKINKKEIVLVSILTRYDTKTT